MSESLDPHEVLQRLARSVAGSLRSEQVMLLRQDGDGLTVATNAVADVDQTRRVAAESDPHLAQLARVAAPVTGTAAETKLDQLATAASWLALPLRIRHEQLGVLLVVSTEPDAFDEAGVGIGATLAAQGMIAYENALLYSKVSELATTDELTSIPNRRRFNELAEQTLARAHRTGSPLTALMLDIDHFKKINDTYGHPVGDEVIRAVSNRLRGHIRGAEVLGRYGGEEFVVLLETGDGFGPAERLRAAIADTPVETAAGHLVVTISIGGAELQASDHAVGTLLGRADLALYEAKRNGRNRVVMYREELAQTA